MGRHAFSGRIVNADHSIMWPAARRRVANCIPDCIWPADSRVRVCESGSARSPKMATFSWVLSRVSSFSIWSLCSWLHSFREGWLNPTLRERGKCDFASKCWEIIADNLKKAGWSWGRVTAIDRDGRTLWIVDAHRDNGKRLVARAEEKLTAFVELESAIAAGRRIALTGWRDSFKTRRSLNGFESGGGHFPR